METSIDEKEHNNDSQKDKSSFSLLVPYNSESESSLPNTPIKKPQLTETSHRGPKRDLSVFLTENLGKHCAAPPVDERKKVRHEVITINSDEEDSEKDKDDQRDWDKVQGGDSDEEEPPEAEKSFDTDIDEIDVLRQRLGYSPCQYANTDCWSRGKNQTISTIDAVKLLLDISPRMDPVAKEAPFRPEDNCVFIIHESSLTAWGDALSDENGSWQAQSGAKSAYFVRSQDELMTTSKEEYEADDDGYWFTRQTWICQSAKDFKRVYIRTKNESCQYSLLYYKFDGDVHAFAPLPHGNRRHGTAQYGRTYQSVKESLKSEDRLTALKAYKEDRNKIYTVSNPASIPSGKKQVRNMTQHSQPVDDVEGLQAKCKKEFQFPSVRFICEINAVPSLFLFLATKRQLDDMAKFCTNEDNFSVLGVDTMFNVGNFFVTVMTYRHLFLRSQTANIGSHPVMIGAIFVHQEKNRSTYWQMAASLKRLCPELGELKVFGTDGDAALYQSFQDLFPTANHLLCDIHMRDNIEKRLRELKEKPPIIVEVIQDIFGKKRGSDKTAGLVDCSEDRFEAETTALYEKWNMVMEDGAEFVRYFREKKVLLILNCMLLSKRVACHLNLDVYTQNANECMNSVIKREANMKKMKLTPFVDAMQKLVSSQEKDIEETLIERTAGLSLDDEYSHLKVSETKFYRLKSEDREKILQKIHKQPVLKRKADLGPVHVFCLYRSCSSMS